ncbi:MAG TPA: nuclear transport factor 2 family protein [Allosphingosinicella sp.]|uniref:nuclear transport factor 2 family protein n=1 Tax=Allosphingosinicella sp. TaxID=2823234 RepID=UPI002ED9844E
MLKRTLVLGAATLLAFGAPQSLIAQSSSGSAEDRTVLEQLNADWLKSYESKDAAALSRILSDSFVGVYGNRGLSKAAMIEGLRDPNRKVKKIEWEDLQIYVNGDTAVVTAVSTLTAVQNGAETVGRSRYADIYVREDGRWRAIAAHVVRLP